jgi:GNAT superfamily N-acetyltransferase
MEDRMTFASQAENLGSIPSVGIKAKLKYGQSEVEIVAGQNGVSAMFGWMSIGRLQLQFHYPDQIYLSGFFVHPLFRGSGIGTKMLEVGIDFCRRHTVADVVRLHCITDRVAFYERAGFKLLSKVEYCVNTMELRL